MTRNMRLAAWGFAAFAVALAVTFSPLIAGFVFAGAALAFIVVLMGMRAARGIGHWRLEHGWRFRRTRSGSASEQHDERRAA